MQSLGQEDLRGQAQDPSWLDAHTGEQGEELGRGHADSGRLVSSGGSVGFLTSGSGGGGEGTPGGGVLRASSEAAQLIKLELGGLEAAKPVDHAQEQGLDGGPDGDP